MARDLVRVMRRKTTARTIMYSKIPVIQQIAVRRTSYFYATEFCSPQHIAHPFAQIAAVCPRFPRTRQLAGIPLCFFP